MGNPWLFLVLLPVKTRPTSPPPTTVPQWALQGGELDVSMSGTDAPGDFAQGRTNAWATEKHTHLYGTPPPKKV